MALPNSIYPIGQYLLRLLRQSELSLELFCIQELAYSDPQEGIQDFLNAVKYGHCSEQINRRLAECTQSPIELESALRRNDDYLQAEAEQVIAEETERDRLAFVPHIRADFSFVGPCRKRPDLSFDDGPAIPNIIIPPEISNLPNDQQLPLLKPLIQEHFAIYGGHITDYGERIDGYRSFTSWHRFEEAEFDLFDTDGEHIPDEPAPWPKPSAKTVKRANRPRKSKSTPTKSRRK